METFWNMFFPSSYELFLSIHGNSLYRNWESGFDFFSSLFLSKRMAGVREWACHEFDLGSSFDVFLENWIPCVSSQEDHLTCERIWKQVCLDLWHEFVFNLHVQNPKNIYRIFQLLTVTHVLRKRRPGFSYTSLPIYRIS